MLWKRGIVRKSARRIADAVDHTVEAWREERMSEEPDFTNRMLGAIEQAMHGFSLKGVSWSARTLTSHMRNAEERRYGADFMGVLSVNLPDYQVNKGFLAQAKRADRLDAREMRRLREQCERMLTLSPDSFVFVYSDTGVYIVPAIAVLAAAPSLPPSELYARSVARFFEEHFESFIGDRAVSSPTPDTLEKLMERFHARRALYIQAESDGSDSQTDGPGRPQARKHPFGKTPRPFVAEPSRSFDHNRPQIDDSLRRMRTW